MKFLCDEMLKRLGQWLRVAGYDVLMLPDGTSDRELIQRAVEEHRVPGHPRPRDGGAGEWQGGVDDARLHRSGRLCERACHGGHLGV